MYSTASTTYKRKDVRWAQNAHHHTPTYLWVLLKNVIYIPGSYTKREYFLDTSMICSSFGEEQRNELQTFLEEINEVHPTIKFDYETSKTEIHFLDITIYKDSNGKLATKVFTKPTDRHAYLHRNSAHPYNLKKSIPYGQALRLRRLCSDDREFSKASEHLKKKFVSRGYRETEIQLQIDRAASQDREETSAIQR